MNVGSLEIKLFADIARLQSDMNKANQTVDRAMGNIDKSVNVAKRAFAGLGGGIGLGVIAKTVDEYKKFDSQLKLATSSANEYAEAYGNVVRIAKTSQSDIGAIGVLYARLTNNLKDFGTTQKEISTITEAVSLSLRVSNATVQETNSVMLQLSQSFGSGKINGQEFLAVAEGAPIIMRQLAKSLNKNYGELKDLSTQGKLTSEVLKTALSDPAYIASLREQAKAVGTISSALTVAKNNWTQYIGEADKGAGTSKLLSQGIILLADNINTLVGVAIAGAIVAFGRFTAAKFASIEVSKVASAQAIKTATLEVEMAALTANAKSIEAQKSVANDRLKAAAKVRLLEISTQEARMEAILASAFSANTAKQTAAMKILETQTYKLIQAKGALAAANGLVGVSMANNASATTMLVSQWQQAESVNNKLTKSVGLSGIAAKGLTSLYALLGGGIGLLVIGFAGLAYAIDKALDSKKLDQYGKSIDGIRERAKALNEQVANGVSIDNKYAAEISNIKDLEKARDGLFAKMKADAQTTSVFKPSLEKQKENAMAYIQSLKDIKNAEKDLGLKIEQDGINGAPKSSRALPDSVKLLSAQIKEQQEIIDAANKDLKAGLIIQTDYNRVIQDATKAIEDLNKVKKADKDNNAEKIRQLTIEANLIKDGVPEVVAKAAAQAKLSGATESQVIAIMNLTQAEFEREAALKLSNEQQKKALDLAKQYTEDLQGSARALIELVGAEEASTAKMQEEIDLLGKGSQYLTDMEVARLRDAAAAYEQNAAMAIQIGLSQENIEYLKQQAKGLNDLADAKKNAEETSLRLNSFKLDKEQADNRIKEAKRATEEIEKDQQQSAERMGDNLSRALTEGLFDSFKDGESFGKAMLRNLLAFGKTFFAQGLQSILGNVFKGIFSGGGSALSGLFGGAASGDSGGGNSILGRLSSIGDIFKSGNASIVSGIESLGAFLSTGSGGLGDTIGDTIGGAIGQYAGAISKVLPFAGAALSLLKGDIKGAIGSGIGAALSFTPLGPIGGIIGSFLGGGLGSLFGGAKLPPRYYSATETAVSGGKFTSTNPVLKYKQAGGNDALKSLNEQVATSLNAILTPYGLGNSLTRVGSVLNKKKSSDGAISADLDGQFFGASTGKIKKGSIQQAFTQLTEIALGDFLVKVIQGSKLSNGVKKFFDGLTKKEDVAEAINTLSGLKSSLADLPKVFDAIRNAIDTTEYTTSIADLKTRFAAIGTYTSLFYTAEEQFATFTKQLGTQLSALDTVLPKTRDEYRKLVDGITVTDESTSNLFNGLVALAPAMDAYFKQLEAQKAQVDALTNSLRDINSFTSLAEYRNYRGVAANYGTNFALDYSANARSGAISVDSNGQASAGGESNLVELLTEIRDYAKQTLIKTSDSTSLLETFDRRGMPARA